MPRFRIHARRALVAASLLLSFVAGCGNDKAAPPTSEAARRALDAALTAWSQGAKPGEVPGSKPPVFVHDTPWSQGQHLASYEILGEDEAADATAEKRFSVRLKLTQPERDENVRYHILGTDPVMVFRDEDYQRNINMENGPSTTRPAGRGRKSK